MKVLVTGATGFIGAHLIKHISQNEISLVFAFLVRSKTGFENFPHELIEGDLESLSDIKPKIMNFSPDCCIHLAWKGLPEYTASDSKKSLDFSIELIDFLVEQTNCKKIVVAGSCLEYGKTEGPCHPSDETMPQSFMAWAKTALYEYCRLKTSNSDVELIWLRIFYVFGFGQRMKNLIPSVFSSLSLKKKVKFRTPYSKNDFIYVSDVVSGVLNAVSSTVPSGIYNLGRGEAVSVLEMGRHIAEYVNFRDGIEQPSSEPSPLKNEVSFWADIDATKKHLKWEPKISLQDGIRENVNELLNNGFNR